MNKVIDVSTVIKDLGGPSKVAEICLLNNPQAVSNWISRGKIPAARLLYLQVVRPDVFKKFGAGNAPEEEKIGAGNPVTDQREAA